jgi:uncharacterized membrane protein
MTRNYYFAGAALIVAVLAVTAVAYPYLPGTVPIHWDSNGNVDGWGGRWTLLTIDPGLMTAILLFFAALPWLSPRHFEVDSFRSTYLYIMVVVLAEMAYTHVLILATSLGWVVDVRRAIEGGFCLLIALLGNVLGKVRRNFFIGVRTPWTLAHAQVWHATHRFAAKTLFAGGLAGLLAVVLRAPSWLPIVMILASALAPVVYSLVFYKQLERHGGL